MSKIQVLPLDDLAVAEVGLEPTSPDSESGAQPVKLLCIDAIFNARK